MNGLELNKIAASILLAGLIAMVVGNTTNFLYKPQYVPLQKGYKIDVQETASPDKTVAAQPQLTPDDIIKIIKAGNPDNGKEIVKKCSLCHTFTNGGPNAVGPNLWNIVGGPQHHKSDYSYSPTLQGANDKWTYINLFHFINSPRTFLPGTKMTFIGLNKPQDIGDVIAYLRTLSDNPIPLP
jgi:cytochrome c